MTSSKLAVAALALATGYLAFACSTAAEPAASTDGGAGDGLDASSAEGGGAGQPFNVAASSGTWTVDQDVTMKGKGTGELGAISLTHGVGTIMMGGKTAAAFVYTHTPVPTGTGDAGTFATEVDYQVIGVTADSVINVWVTCAQGQLAYVYYESTTGPDSTMEQAATGTCDIAMKSTAENVMLPAFAFPPPKLLPGYTITGAQLSYDGVNPGSVTLAGKPYALYPYNVVDCAACSTTGWQELHSMMWNPEDASVCEGILYLQANDPKKIQLAYLMCLPGLTGLTNGAQAIFAASFTLPK